MPRKKRTVQRPAAKSGRRLRLLPVAIVVIAAIAAAAYFLTQDVGGGQYFGLAQCMSDSGATMYGSEKCFYCQREKREIGADAFKQHFTDTHMYVRCESSDPIGDAVGRITSDKEIQADESTTMNEICNQVVVDKTPTWVFGDGTRVVGLMNIPALAQASGCPIPDDYKGTLEPIVGGHTG